MRMVLPQWVRDRWRLGEYILLASFLLSRVLLMTRTYNDGAGWDSGDHLEMIDHWPWEEEVWSVRSHFYAFHPQFGFLLARILFVLGMHRDASAQTVAALAMLVVFFGMRWILRRFGLLHTARGLVMLYGGASLPVQIYLARSINLDALLQANAVLLIVLTILLRDGAGRWAYIALIGTLAAGVLTKLTAVALFAVPCIVLLCFEPSLRRIDLRRLLRIAVLPPIIAAVLVAPYFAARYVLPEGRLFITNMDMEEYDAGFLRDDRERLADRGNWTLWTDLVWGMTPGSEPLDTRDTLRVRLVNGWKDLWASNFGNIRQSGWSYAFSSFYAWVGSALLLLGIARCARRGESAQTWRRLGMVLALIAAVQCAKLLVFIARYPHPVGNPTKAVYIAPALLVLWYLLGAAAPRGMDRKPLLVVGILAAWTLLNGGLPVY